MNDQNSNHAKKLFEEVWDLSSEDRAQALAAVSDPLLRREVEELLDFSSRTSDLLRSPAIDLVPKDKPLLERGVRLDCRYVIDDFLKQGGFSKVYLGHDERLDNKTVVIKVLDEFDGNIRDFVSREVRAIARIQHSGVASIYDQGVTEQGFLYLVLEYVPGITLAEAMRSNSSAIREPYALIMQLAECLSAVHQNGVFHLDVKPENIILTQSGNGSWRPVLIDFGISQLVGTYHKAHTSLAGSPGYMEPERGQASVSVQADIYSLGTVAKRLLDKSSAAIDKATSHEPHRRQKSVSEFAGQLLQEQRRYRIVRWAAGVALLSFVTLLVWQMMRGARQIELSAMPVTSGLGFEGQPTFSPDGQTLFFAGGTSEDSTDLYFLRLGSPEPERLRGDEGREYSPRCSPSGKWLSYLHRSPKFLDGQIKVMLMNLDTREAREIYSAPYIDTQTFSSDEQHLVIAQAPNGGSPPSLWSIDLATSQRQRLTTPQDHSHGDTAPALSPDGRQLVFCRHRLRGVGDLFVVAVGTDGKPRGPERQLTRLQQRVDSPQWTPDGQEIVFASGRLGLMRLWRVRADSGDAAPIPGQLSRVERLAIPRLAARLAFGVDRSDSNLWELALSEDGLNVEGARRLAPSSFHDEEAEYSYDSKRIVFTSPRMGSPQLWVMNRDGSELRPVTQLHNAEILRGFWMPDSRSLLVSFQDLQPATHQLTLDDGKLRPMIPNGLAESVSRDGNFAYVRSSRPGFVGIWRVNLKTGEWIESIDPEGRHAIETLDGSGVLFSKQNEADGISYMSLKTGERWRIPAVLRRRTAFAPGRSGVYFAARGKDEPDLSTLRFYSYSDRSIRTMYKFPEGEVFFGFSLAPDGRSILYSHLESTNLDLMLIQDFR
jgi:Tol biopolymer transport system component/tRNA A-37 threonylcarbamoyl transferase component Bud32